MSKDVSSVEFVYPVFIALQVDRVIVGDSGLCCFVPVRSMCGVNCSNALFVCGVTGW